MLCDECKQRPATVHVTKIINGQKVSRHLCQQCAEEKGFLPHGGVGGDFGNLFDFPGFFEFPDLFASVFKRRSADRIYDYFSPDAQKILTLAGEEAQRLRHDHVRTEHLLLALIKEEGTSAQILKNLKVDLVNLFSDIETLVGHGIGTPKQITLSPRAKKVMQLAYNAARELGFNYVGPEHIMLGIIREGESVAAQALHKRKVNFDKVAREIIKLEDKGQPGPSEPEEFEQPEEGGEIPEEFLGGPEAGAMFGYPGIGLGAPPHQKKPALTSYGRDMTAEAKAGKLDPVIDREKETDRVIRILSRRTKNNPALIGDPGVGKTAIVEGLAERIVRGDVPDILKDKQVISLDLAGMVAGTKYRGEFEARVKKVLEEVVSKGRKIILFIDELHTLVGAGGAEGAIDAANILKPALARGDLQMIGATTVDEYRKNVEKDPALERRFQPVLVNEPDVELTIQILKGIRGKYEEHHGVKIPDEALIAAASLSERYISDRFLPDKAIDLMDEAASKVRLRLITPTPELRALRREYAELKEKEAADTKIKKYEEAAKTRDAIKKLSEKLQKAEETWKCTVGKESCIVTEDDIAEIVADWTGIPVVKLSEAETQKLMNMEGTLHKRVVGQEDAIKSISQAIRRGRAGLKPPNKPVGSFIFAGPTGVGKTEVARRLAEFLFGTMDALIRIDMSEFMEKHTVSRLIGAPPGYVGYEEGGKLTEAVRRKPYSVILFDEIEKAHPDVFNILLQILDDGRLTDSKGHVVDFKNTVIIMTTNIGQKLITDQGPMGFVTSGAEEATYDRMKETVLSEMKKDFRPEFLNRIDEIIIFHPLSDEHLKQVTQIMVSDVEKQMQEHGMDLQVTDGAKEIIIKEGHDPKFGARPLRRAIQQLIENPLSNKILEGEFKEGEKVIADAQDGKIIFKHGGKYEPVDLPKKKSPLVQKASGAEDSSGEKPAKQGRKKIR